MVGCDLGHHVAGAVVAIFVEGFGGDFGALVIAGCAVLRFDQQLAARIGLVGGEVAQLGDVDEFVVDHRRADDDAVPGHRDDLGQAIQVAHVHVEARLQKRPQLAGQRRGADGRAEHPAAELLVPQFDGGFPLRVGDVGAIQADPVHRGPVVLKEHFDNPGHQQQIGGSHQRPVVEQRRQI